MGSPGWQRGPKAYGVDPVFQRILVPGSKLKMFVPDVLWDCFKCNQKDSALRGKLAKIVLFLLLFHKF